mgnify:CR=1 FL=1
MVKNIIKEFANGDNLGRNRFGGIGASIIRYPYEDIADYIAYSRAIERIGSGDGAGQWLKYDEAYKKERAEFNQQIEKEREHNLVLKEAVIADLKALLEKQEDVAETFPQFRQIQDRWRAIGQVPPQNYRNINETYQLYVEQFYDMVKINRELRDLDFKKNLEAKEQFCAYAEKLAENPNVVEGFRDLQKLHEQWKEFGPVAKEFRDSVWERFKAATSVVNKKYQSFFEGVKEQQAENLQKKTVLCEKVEEIAEREVASSNEWNSFSKEIEEIQKEWKTIGFASRKDNQKIYDRFRAACDKFFERKAAHFSSVDSQHEENLKLKQALLEEMKAADVKAGGFEAIKRFQQRWSQIGFVPIKFKDAIQKEYKAIVDGMFATLRSSERDRSMNRFRERVSNMKGGNQLRSERERLFNKVRQLEQDIALLENNIGFFSKSKNAETLIADVREKIERSKRDMAEIIEKIKLIDEQEAQHNA